MDDIRTTSDSKVNEPFPIFRVRHRHLLFDVEIITYVRRVHHICGVLIGNIPIAAQQNVFSGIPLELMPEEARLLTEHLKVAFVVDDVVAHERMRALNGETRQAFVEHVEGKKVASALRAKEQADLKRRAHFEKIEKAKMLGLQKQKERQQAVQNSRPSNESGEQDGDSLFGPTNADDASVAVAHQGSTELKSTNGDSERMIVPHDYTPTTSYPPLVATAEGTSQTIVETTSAYYLFAYLHLKGYFLSPGLRFGCNFVAYPGDPLRYHSHFLSVNKDWDEPIDLIDIVGGGRLGTGVKKGFLVGGVETLEKDSESVLSAVDDVRVFCFEWAAM